MRLLQVALLLFRLELERKNDPHSERLKGHLLPVLGWRQSDIAPERPTEMVGIGMANLPANIRDRSICANQQLLGFLQPNLLDVFVWSGTQRGPK